LAYSPNAWLTRLVWPVLVVPGELLLLLLVVLASDAREQALKAWWSWPSGSSDLRSGRR